MGGCRGCPGRVRVVDVHAIAWRGVAKGGGKTCEASVLTSTPPPQLDADMDSYFTKKDEGAAAGKAAPAAPAAEAAE